MFSVVDLEIIERASNYICTALELGKNIPVTLNELRQKSEEVSEINFSYSHVGPSGRSIRIFKMEPCILEKDSLQDVLTSLGYLYGKYLRPEFSDKYLNKFAFHFMLSILMPKAQFDMKLLENGFSVLNMEELNNLFKSDKDKVHQIIEEYLVQHEKDMARFEDIVPSIASFFNVSEDFVRQRAEDLFLLSP